MRRALLLLVLVLLSSASTQAEEESIPIQVAPLHGIEVTDGQLAWVRTWLREHLHPIDLAGVVVDVDNRTHPTSLVCAEARLPAKEVDTYHVQRVIRLGHETWDVYRDGYGFEGAERIGPWRVLDTYRVQRVFPLGDGRKLLRLADDVTYVEVHALLRAVHTKAVRVLSSAFAETLPVLDRIIAISKDEEAGRYMVMQRDLDDPHAGLWFKGTVEDGLFVIHESGPWIS